jgi:Transposase DDE domain
MANVNSRTNPCRFFNTLQQQLPAAAARLQDIPAEALARRSGFLARSPRKIPMGHFLKGLLALAPETNLSLERTASVIGLAAQKSYSKQALSERLSPQIQPFLASVITASLGQLPHSVDTSRLLSSFARVLVQDSTVERVPPHLAPLFPGGGNQHGRQGASLKIQWICDLKNSAVAHLSLSGFTRNDQAAAPDILEVAQSGDLILRDLGYLLTMLLPQMTLRGILFLSRHRHDIGFHDPQTSQPFPLSDRLRLSPSLDLPLLLGPERAPVRLVALPVPEEVANRRRQKAKADAQRRHRSPPSQEHLFLMGWNLFLTNVPTSLWPPKALVAVYRLRWRIEIIFKTWKSHLGLRQLNCRTAALLQLSVLTKLLFCALVCQVCDVLELHCAAEDHVSLLRLGHILGQAAGWFSALVLGITVSQWLQFALAHHAFYEKRKDRQNYYQLLAHTGTSLT